MSDPMTFMARSLSAVALGTALLAITACGGSATAPDASAPEGAAPAGAPSDLSDLATGDVVILDRTQMADQPCHGMANTVMGNCTSQEEIDAAIAAMSINDPIIVDRNTMDDQPCHVMGGMVMGACTMAEAQAKVDEIRASR